MQQGAACGCRDRAGDLAGPGRAGIPGRRTNLRDRRKGQPQNDLEPPRLAPSPDVRLGIARQGQPVAAGIQDLQMVLARRQRFEFKLPPRARISLGGQLAVCTHSLYPHVRRCIDHLPADQDLLRRVR